MSIRKFLQAKFVDWQYQQRERKTLDDFAAFIGISRPLLSQWMNGKKKPGPENKERLIELYGNDALEAFGKDPDLYIVEKGWDDLNSDVKQKVVELVRSSTKQNDTKRTSQKRTTRTSD